jgi:hypothetical protein
MVPREVSDGEEAQAEAVQRIVQGRGGTKKATAFFAKENQ